MRHILIGTVTGEIERKRSRFIATAAEVHCEAEALAFIEKIRKKYWDARHNCYAFIVTDSADGNNLSRDCNSGIKSNANTAEIPQQGRESPGNIELLRVIQRFSDDGEPSGTAGRPILDILSGRNMLNTCIVVTRYFGGTLLGTGGLIRAYTDAAAAALDSDSASASSDAAGDNSKNKDNESVDTLSSFKVGKTSSREHPSLKECGIHELKSGFVAGLTCEYSELGKIQYALAQNEISVISSEFGERPSMELIVPDGAEGALCEKLADITAGRSILKIGRSVFYYDTVTGPEIYIP